MPGQGSMARNFLPPRTCKNERVPAIVGRQRMHHAPQVTRTNHPNHLPGTTHRARRDGDTLIADEHRSCGLD